MTLLDMIGKLSQVQLRQLNILIKPMLAETQLWETPHHVTLASFESTADVASSPRILTFMTLTSCLAEATAWTSANSPSCAARVRVVPEIVCSEG